MKPATVQFGSPINAVFPLTDGRLVVDTSLGAAVLVDGRSEPLPPSPLRWPGRPERWGFSVWEELGAGVRPLHPNLASEHVYVIREGSPPRLLRIAHPGVALPGLAGEAVTVGHGALARIDVTTGELRRQAGAVETSGGVRIADRVVAWNQSGALRAFDLELTPAAQATTEFIHAVHVVDDWLVVMTTRQALVMDAGLERYATIDLPHVPSVSLADAAQGWIHVASGRGVSALDVRAAKLRWTAPDQGATVLARSDDVLACFERLRQPTELDPEPATWVSMLDARFGGRADIEETQTGVLEAVGLPGGAFAWLRPGRDPDQPAHRRMFARARDGEAVELRAHDEKLHGFCVDAKGVLVSWGLDGTVARWPGLVDELNAGR